jgi:molybdenum cofactor cytidylyltransferase
MPESAGAAPFKFGAVVLAAGGSSRMGTPKQLLEIDGLPLVARAADAVIRSGASPIVLVLGAEAERVRAAVAGRPLLVVPNPEWGTGIASSIRAGIAALVSAEPGLDAALISTSDQPALSGEVILRLLALHRASGRIASARYAGRNGAPAIFGRGRFAELMGLAGDEGARRLLNSDAGGVVAAEFPDLEHDIDTFADLDDWKRRSL